MSLSIQAQKDKTPNKRREAYLHWDDGFVVGLHGDTIYGKIKVTTGASAIRDNLQDAVSFADTNGVIFRYTPGKLRSFTYIVEHQFKPDEDRSFSFQSMDLFKKDTITMVSIKDPHNDEILGGKVFCKLYIDGPCKKYGYSVLREPRVPDITNSFESNKHGYSEFPQSRYRDITYRVECNFIQMRSSEPEQISELGFKKTMKKIFHDCPLILAKVESGEVDYDNQDEAVKDYNKGICK